MIAKIKSIPSKLVLARYQGFNPKCRVPVKNCSTSLTAVLGFIVQFNIVALMILFAFFLNSANVFASLSSSQITLDIVGAPEEENINIIFSSAGDDGAITDDAQAIDYASIDISMLANCLELPSNAYCAEYFNTINLSGTPVWIHNEPSPLSHDWGWGAPVDSVNNDNFSVRWSGLFDFNQGSYNFLAQTDSRFRFFLDGSLMMDQWGAEGGQFSETYYISTPGSHVVTVEYSDRSGRSEISFDWLEEAQCGNVQVNGNSFSCSNSGKDFSFIGLNMPGLAHIDTMYPDDNQRDGIISEQIRAAKNMNASVIRIFAPHRDKTNNDIFNGIDELISLLDREDPGNTIKISITLNDFYKSYFAFAADVNNNAYGAANYLIPEWFVASPSNWDYTDSGGYLDFVTAIVSRYANSDRIFAWSIGNEFQYQSDIQNTDMLIFSYAVGNLIKSLDSNHLLTTGFLSVNHATNGIHVSPVALDSTIASFYGDTSPFDFATVHGYGNNWSPAELSNNPKGEYNRVDVEIASLNNNNFPYIFEEFGFEGGFYEQVPQKCILEEQTVYPGGLWWDSEVVPASSEFSSLGRKNSIAYSMNRFFDEFEAKGLMQWSVVDGGIALFFQDSCRGMENDRLFANDSKNRADAHVDWNALSDTYQCRASILANTAESADLYIKNIEKVVVVGDVPLSFKITVYNGGSVESESATRVGLYIGPDGTDPFAVDNRRLIDVLDVPPLQPGQSEMLESASWKPVSAGKYTLAAVVNDTNQVNEVGRTCNNGFYINVDVSSCALGQLTDCVSVPDVNGLSNPLSSGEMTVMDMTVDDENNIIIVGSFRNTITLGQDLNSITLTASSDWDAFIAKFTPSFNLIWAQRAGNMLYDAAQHVVTFDNEISVSGVFRHSMTFASGAVNELTIGTGSNSYHATFIAHYGKGGDFQWGTSVRDSPAPSSFGTDLGITQNGEILLLDDLNGALNAHKFSAIGDELWTTRFRDPDAIDLPDRSFFITAFGDTVIAGGFYNDIVGTSGTMIRVYSSDGVPIVLPDNNLPLLWEDVIKLPGIYLERAQVDRFGDLVLAGPVGSMNNPSAIAIQKYRINRFEEGLDLLWSRTINSLNNVNDMIIKRNGNLLLTGSFSGAVDFGNSYLLSGMDDNLGDTDSYILELYPDASTSWAKQGGGNGEDAGVNLSYNSNGDIITTGSFFSSANFDDLVVQGSASSTYFAQVGGAHVIAEFSQDFSNGFAPLSINFNDASYAVNTTITSWQWDFADGSPIVTDPSPNHVFLTAGNYPVTLKVSDGSVTDIKTMLIEVGSASPIVNILPNAHDFGAIDMGSPSNNLQVITLTNISNSSVTIMSIDFGNQSVFSVDLVSNACADIILEAASQCSFSVVFIPTEYSFYTANIRINNLYVVGQVYGRGDNYPLASSIPGQVIDEDTPFTSINLTDYGSDVDTQYGDVIDWSVSGNNTLNIFISFDNIATISAPQDWNGSEVISFVLSDSHGISDESVAQFIVNPINDPPTIEVIPSHDIYIGESLNYQAVANDIDGQIVNFTIIPNPYPVPDGMTVDANGLISWTPVESQVTGSSYLLGLQATDDLGLAIVRPFAVRALSADSPPTEPLNPTPTSGSIDQELNAILGWDASIDADGDSLSYDIYLGTDAAALTWILNTQNIFFDLSSVSDIANGTTYYWQVIARSLSNQTAGQIWNFSTINTVLSAEFSATPTVGLAPLTAVQFNDESQSIGTTINSWSWDFNNDGVVDSIQQNPSYDFIQAGSYSITLTVSDGVTTDTQTKTDYIQVLNENISMNASAITCSSEYAVGWCQRVADITRGMCNQGEWASAGEMNAWVKFEWTTPQSINSIHLYDRSCPEQVQSGTLQFNDNPLDTVSFGQLEDTGNDASIVQFNDRLVSSVQINIVGGGAGINQGLSEIEIYSNASNTPLTANFGVDLMSINAGDIVQFTDQSIASNIPITSWSWDFDNDGLVDSNLQNPNYPFDIPGVYSVTLSITDGVNSSTETKVNLITVEASMVNIAPTATNISCSSEYALGWCQYVIDQAHGNCNQNEWASAGQMNAWVRFEWDVPQQVDSISLYDRACPEQIQSGTIVFDDDPLTSESFGTLENSGTFPTSIDFAQRTVTSLQINVIGGGFGNNQGLSEVQVFRSTAQTQLTADFSADTQVGFNPLNVSFIDTSTSIGTTVNQWAWDFDNDGIIDSNLQHPFYQYQLAGTYDVSLSVSDGALSDTKTNMGYITVTDPGFSAWVYPQRVRLFSYSNNVDWATLADSGTLFIQSEFGTLIALDTSLPTQLWESSNIAVTSMVIGDDNRVYVLNSNSPQSVLGLNPLTGLVEKTIDLSSIPENFSQLSVGIDGQLYLRKTTGVVALSTSSESILWEYSGASGPFILSQTGEIYIVLANSVQQINADGSPGWTTSVDADINSSNNSIIFENSQNLIVSEAIETATGRGYLHRINISGQLLTSEELTILGQIDLIAPSNPVVAADGTIYITATGVGFSDPSLYFQGVCAIATLPLRPSVCSATDYPPSQIALGNDDRLYVTDGEQEIGDINLYAFDLNLIQQWKYQTSEGTLPPTPPIVGTNGVVYFAGIVNIYAIQTGATGLAISVFPKYKGDNKNTSRLGY